MLSKNMSIMSGAGHVQDMNNRIRQNRAQRPSNRQKFKEHNRENIYSSNQSQQGLKFKSVSEEKLAEIKKEIKQRANIAQKKNRLLLLTLLIIVLIAAILVVRLI